MQQRQSPGTNERKLQGGRHLFNARENYLGTLAVSLWYGCFRCLCKEEIMDSPTFSHTVTQDETKDSSFQTAQLPATTSGLHQSCLSAIFSGFK